MARQTNEDCDSINSLSDQCSKAPSSYVKKAKVIFEQQTSERSSGNCLVQAQRSRNMQISFSLHGRSLNDAVRCDSDSRSKDTAMPMKCQGNAAGKYQGCMRPVVRQISITSSRSSDPTLTSTKIGEHRALLDVTSGSVVKCQSASDLQLTFSVERPNVVAGPVKCCNAMLNMSRSSDTVAESVSARAAVSPGCGE